MSRLRVGLTGGLASGKSTVARLLAERGCTVLDADQVVAELYQPGGAGARAVAELFGHGMLDGEGAVDRPRLAQRVFADGAARKRLEAAIHPLVRQRTNEMLEGAQGIVVYEATLLVEAGRADDVDLVVSVEASPEDQLARAVARGMDEAAARARLVAQRDGAARRARADLVLENAGSLADLHRKVDELLSELERRAAGHEP